MNIDRFKIISAKALRFMLAPRLATIISHVALVVLLTNVTPVEAARKLYVLTIADTQDPSIGKHSASDIQQIKSVMTNCMSKSDLVMLPPLLDARATQKAITTALNRLNPSPQDAVFVYYSGHGGYREDNRHYLITQNQKEWIPRQAIVETLKSKNFGLVVLISDSCHNFGKQPKPTPEMAPGQALPHSGTRPLFQKLFFQAKGLIDINSAKKDQYAGTFPDSSEGSIFTSSFAQTLSNARNERTQTWSSLIEKVDQSTRATFRNNYPEGETVITPTGAVNQRDQRLVKLTFDVRYGGTEKNNGEGISDAVTSVRLGLVVRDSQENNVKIISVVAGGPVTRCREEGSQQTFTLEPDDVITAINGMPVRNVFDFIDQVHNCFNGKATLNVTGKAGDAHQFAVQLNSSNNTNPPPMNRGTRFGAYVTTNGNQVRVTGVVPGSPAVRCRGQDGQDWQLEDGDIIRRVNGEYVFSEQEFRQAIANSGREMTLEVRGKDGNIYQFSVTLNY